MLLRRLAPGFGSAVARLSSVSISRHALASTRVLRLTGVPTLRTSALATIGLAHLSTTSSLETAPSLHSYSGIGIDKQLISLSSFAGKPVLMVNVASR